MFHSTRPSRFHRVLILIALILATVLAATPAFATDPEQADPDPDGASQVSDPRSLFFDEFFELVRDGWNRFSAFVDGGVSRMVPGSW